LNYIVNMAYLFLNKDKRLFFGGKNLNTIASKHSDYQGYIDGGLGYSVTVTDEEFENLENGSKKFINYNSETNVVSYETVDFSYLSSAALLADKTNMIKRLQEKLDFSEYVSPLPANEVQQIQNFKNSLETIDPNSFTYPLTKTIYKILQENNLYYISPLQ